MSDYLNAAKRNTESVANSLGRHMSDRRPVRNDEITALAQAQALVALTEAVQELTRTIAEHQ